MRVVHVRNSKQSAREEAATMVLPHGESHCHELMAEAISEDVAVQLAQGFKVRHETLEDYFFLFFLRGRAS